MRGIYGVQPGELSVAAAYPSLAVPAGDTLLSSMIKRKQRGDKKESKRRVLVNELRNHPHCTRRQAQSVIELEANDLIEAIDREAKSSAQNKCHLDKVLRAKIKHCRSATAPHDSRQNSYPRDKMQDLFLRSGH